MAKLANFFTTP